MRIVIANNPEQPTPPPMYGGTQRRSDFIARGLSARGHDVTLLCGPNSTCQVNKVEVNSAAMSEEKHYVEWARCNKWDCLLDMTSLHLLGQKPYLPDGAKTLSMMSGDPFKLYAHDALRNRMYVSQPFADFYGCPDHPVISNIPTDNPEEFPLGDGSGGFFLYMGTVRPEKGVHLAAMACKHAGFPLIVDGPVQDRFLPYFGTFKDSVEYIGEIGGDARLELLGKAKALLYPVLWCDASPLAVKESLLCGTPVIGCPNGGIMEDIGESNGLLIRQDHLMWGLLTTCDTRWDRENIRRQAIIRMNPKNYLDKVEALLVKVANGEQW